MDRARSWAGERCGRGQRRPLGGARTALVQPSECRATSSPRSSRRVAAQGGRTRARSQATMAVVALDLATHGAELRDRPIHGAEPEPLVKLGHASQQRNERPAMAPSEVEPTDADLVPAVRVMAEPPHASIAAHLPPPNVTGGSGRVAPMERSAAASKRSASRAAARACARTERGVAITRPPSSARRACGSERPASADRAATRGRRSGRTGPREREHRSS